MIKLYIDFDGVILNTIDVTYQMMDEQGIDLNIANNPQVIEFYKSLDWEDIIKRSKPINHSLEYLKQLVNSECYDVSILTHVISKQEREVKTRYLKQYIPNIDIIFVEKMDKKCDVVACQNAVLVDDYMGNLELWENKGGIPIKFSTTGKKYHCLTIHCLGQLLEFQNKISDLLTVNN